MAQGMQAAPAINLAKDGKKDDEFDVLFVLK